MIQVLPEAATEAAAPTDDVATRARRLTRGWWWVALLVVAVVVVGLLNQRDGTNGVPLHPRNPGPDGAMAAAEVLRDRGVDVVLVDTLPDALAALGADGTLFVADLRHLSPTQLEEIGALGGSVDVVIAGNPYTDLAPLTDAVAASTAGTTTAVAASCADPDALAAARVTSSVGSVTALRDGVEVCFPTADGAGAFASWGQNGAAWRYLAEPRLMTNELLASDGNAALTFRALGHRPTLVWFLPTEASAGVTDRGTSPLPPWAGPLGLVAAGVALTLALRGRHMGRVVTEPLPVVIKPGEAVRGRGRLYRRSRASAHAAASLRAGTARRLAARLGLSRSADARTVVAAVAASSGREPDAVGALLYGPAPMTNAHLVDLSAALQHLESEVHQ